MEYKVSELEGALLDAAVAKAEGLQFAIEGGFCLAVHSVERWSEGGGLKIRAGFEERAEPFSPSARWEQGGPIIEREHISVDSRRSVTVELSEPQALWMAYIHDGPQLVACGPTPLVAAMRLYVLVKFGETVELP